MTIYICKVLQTLYLKEVNFITCKLCFKALDQQGEKEEELIGYLLSLLVCSDEIMYPWAQFPIYS